MSAVDLLQGTHPDLDSKLALFHPITLGEMDYVRLLDRLDTKFTFSSSLLPDILEEMTGRYSILDIEGIRISRYETVYFDTQNHLFYLHHHNGKLNRYKVRFRRYVDSGDTFFEIKLKNNKGRMIKERIPVSGVDEVISGSAEKFLSIKTDFDPAGLMPSLTVLYSRITLVGRNTRERITIDTNLTYCLESRELAFPHLVIAESKQSKSSHSMFADIMHKHHIRSISVSKYCLGIASLNEGIKCNNFKNKIHHINHLNHDFQ